MEINRYYAPQLAKLAESPFDSDYHLFEPKYDGIRCLAYVSAGEHVLLNRNFHDITVQFPEIRFDTRYSYVLDGELVCFTNFIPDFQKMQTRMHRTHDVKRHAYTTPATYCVFDVLVFEDFNLVDQKVALIHRKDVLQANVHQTEHVVLAPYHFHSGIYTLEQYKGWEGLIAKVMDAPYREGARTTDWMKIKPRHTETVYVIGATQGFGKRTPFFGSLLIARKRLDGTFNILGEVGTGYTDEQIRDLLLRLTIPCTSYSPSSRLLSRLLYCCEPFAIRASYLELTKDGQFRFPSFEGFVE